MDFCASIASKGFLYLLNFYFFYPQLIYFRLKTTVTYIPEIIPAPPSPLRQNAYLESTFLPGPERDPDGWVTLPSAVVSGKLKIADLTIDVQCTVNFHYILLYCFLGP